MERRTVVGAVGVGTDYLDVSLEQCGMSASSRFGSRILRTMRSVSWDQRKQTRPFSGKLPMALGATVALNYTGSLASQITFKSKHTIRGFVHFSSKEESLLLYIDLIEAIGFTALFFCKSLLRLL